MFEQFKKTEVNKKFIATLFGCVILVSFVFSGLIFLDYDRVKSISPENMIINTDEVMYYIDDVSDDSTSFTVCGWATRTSAAMDVVKNYVVIKDTSTGSYKRIATEMAPNPAINTVFDDGNDHSNGGFFARVNKWHLKKGHKYEIYIAYLTNDNNILVATDAVLEY